MQCDMGGGFEAWRGRCLVVFAGVQGRHPGLEGRLYKGSA